jgi:hypothetical protein
LPEVEIADAKQEFVGGKEESDKPVSFEEGITGGQIVLREFTGLQLPAMPPSNLTIQSVYKAEVTASQHRLHDQMVLLIAQICRSKGAAVYEDPSSVDLLVEHQQQEFIIEVKSVTPRNFISRLRYALGQVLHYDFLRKEETSLPRRKVIAFAAQIPANSWSIGFLNGHMDMDMLTLEAGQLRVHSSSQASVQLFG